MGVVVAALVGRRASSRAFRSGAAGPPEGGRSGSRRSSPSQIALGAATVLTGKAVVVTTAHVAAGALLLGSTLAFGISSLALERRRSNVVPIRPADGGEGRRMEVARAAPRSRRAVARRRLRRADEAADHGARARDGGRRLRRRRRRGPSRRRASCSSWRDRPLCAPAPRRSTSTSSGTPTRGCCARSRRPLPAGRIRPEEALAFGLALSGGRPRAAAGVNLADARARRASLLSYVLAYTPLKRVTSLCTVVGAVPGRAAAADGLGGRAGQRSARPGWALFAILFLWQLPHFLAIGWLYREDYARGGFPMLAVTDRDGASTGRQARPVRDGAAAGDARGGLLAAAGHGYLWGALVSGSRSSPARWLFAWKRSTGAARRLFLVSVLYLPLLLGLMVFDR